MTKNAHPNWATTMRARTEDGLLVGVDGSVWAYFEVPLGSVTDAKTARDALHTAGPILAAFQGLADMTPVRAARRSLSKSKYREVHLQLVNIPTLYRPAESHPLHDYLLDQFGHETVLRRQLLLGVKLRASVTAGNSLQAAARSVIESLVTGDVPLSDYADDFARVRAAMARSSMSVATQDQISLANAWWNAGRHADTPVLPHPGHIHIFKTAAAVDAVVAANKPETCSDWPTIPDAHAITFASVESFDLPPRATAADPGALWASNLVRSGVTAISVRGLIEPSKNTREELRSNENRYTKDLREREATDKLSRHELDGLLAEMRDFERWYAGDGVPPTLIDTSIVVGFDGAPPSVEDYGDGASLVLNEMTLRQDSALYETMVCSPVRANPHHHDLPAFTVACSGLPSLSTVGDSPTEPGLLVGFSENDRVPAYLSPTAASTADGLPMALVLGATGSGKSVFALHAADALGRMDVPTVFVDPKPESDHSAAVQMSGGQVASLDDLVQSDGVFDPIRFAPTADAGCEMASSMLLSVNPWGTDKMRWETSLMRSLSYGVKEAGARCTGQALLAARDAGVAPPEMVKPVLEAAESSPLFRACVGFDPTTQPLSVFSGVTLIKVGSSHLEIPSRDHRGDLSLSQRIATALVRMMVFGTTMALAGRGGGVVILDEAWLFLEAGRTEVDRLGRIARSQNVLPILMTQKAQDALDADLVGYISRGLILPIHDEIEAAAACDLFQLEKTPERMARITARATLGSAGSNDSAQAPNWDSMRALRDPRTGRILRGPIAIYADLAGRAVPVEIVVPQGFLEQASTNPEDVRRRRGSLVTPTAR